VIEFLQSGGSGLIKHSQRSLFDHLLATYKILRSWDASEALSLAGLFHSVYGTASFKPAMVSSTKREEVRLVIGEEAEALVWLFGMMTPQSFRGTLNLLFTETVETPAFVLTHRLTSEAMSCSRADFLSLINLTVANALEQAARLQERYDRPKQAELRKLLPYTLPGAAFSFAAAFTIEG